MKRILLALMIVVLPAVPAVAGDCGSKAPCCCGDDAACAADQTCAMMPALPAQEGFLAPEGQVQAAATPVLAAGLLPSFLGLITSHAPEIAGRCRVERGSPPRAVLVSFQL